MIGSTLCSGLFLVFSMRLEARRYRWDGLFGCSFGASSQSLVCIVLGPFVTSPVSLGAHLVANSSTSFLCLAARYIRFVV